MHFYDDSFILFSFYFLHCLYTAHSNSIEVSKALVNFFIIYEAFRKKKLGIIKF